MAGARAKVRRLDCAQRTGGSQSVRAQARLPLRNPNRSYADPIFFKIK